MKLVFGLILALYPQEKQFTSIVDLAGDFVYELSVPFPGDTIVHIPNIDLTKELSLRSPIRVVSDERGVSKIYYYQGWRVSYHQISGQRNGSTISRQ